MKDKHREALKNMMKTLIVYESLFIEAELEEIYEHLAADIEEAGVDVEELIEEIGNDKIH